MALRQSRISVSARAPCSRSEAHWSRRCCRTRCRGRRPCLRGASGRAQRDRPEQIVERESEEQFACHQAGGSRRKRRLQLRRSQFRVQSARAMDANSHPSCSRFWRRRTVGARNRHGRCCPTRRSSMPPIAPATLRQAQRGGDRQPRSRPARPPGRALPTAPCGDRLQYRFHDRARPGAVGARSLPVVGTVPAIKPPAEMSKTRVIGVLGTEATVRQPYVDDLAANSPPTARSSAMVARARRAGRSEARRRRGQRRSRPRSCATDVRCPTATGSTSASSPALHFPLLDDELRGLSWIAYGRRRTRHRPPHRLSSPRPALARTSSSEG